MTYAWLFLILTILFHSHVTESDKIHRKTFRCFMDPPIGCFSRLRPYNNSPYLPFSPRYINIRYTHHVHKDHTTFPWRDASTVMKSRFRPESKTVVIVHGYTESGTKPWVRKMVAAFVSLEEPINVVVVDWRRGASVISYLKSISNGRVVAAMVALFLKDLITLGANPASFHIIGNSLGAHVAGDIASRVPGTGRITGLDPSRRRMIGFGPQVRLDPTDATIVDVIHTDGHSFYGYGTQFPMGTVDFYPNGGLNQPGCPNNVLEVFLDLFWLNHEKCAHSRAIELFTESILPSCLIEAGKCSGVNEAIRNRCPRCGAGNECINFGYHLDPTVTGIYTFQTGDKEPFCQTNLGVSNATASV